MPTLVIQQGHCYRTTGATGTTGEQQFATAVAEAAVRLLHGRNGWQVKRILADVPVNQYGGNAFAAIHCDGSVNSSARGASVGYQTNSGRTFGQAWKRAYAARGWKGGFRADNYTSALAGYYGVRNAVSVANHRAIIIESGFLTNPNDRAQLTGKGGPERVALAIGDALGITVPQEDDDMTPRELLDAKFGSDVYSALEPWADKPGTVGHFLRNMGQDTDALRTYVDTLEATNAAILSKLEEVLAAVRGSTQ